MRRSQELKSFQERKQQQILHAQEVLKQAQEREQKKIEDILNKAQYKDRIANELLNKQQEIVNVKAEKHRVEYDQRLVNIKSRITEMEIDLQKKSNRKQEVIEKRVNDRQLYKQILQSELRRKSQEQMDQINKTKYRKFEMMEMRKKQIQDSLKVIDERQKQYQDYQKLFLLENLKQSQEKYEQLEKKRKSIEISNQDHLQKKYEKVQQACTHAEENYLKRQKYYKEYLNYLDKLKEEQKIEHLNYVQQSIEERRKSLETRTNTQLANASVKAEKIRQESVRQMMDESKNRFMNFKSNRLKQILRDELRKNRISLQLEMKSQRYLSVDGFSGVANTSSFSRTAPLFINLKQKQEEEEIKRLLLLAEKVGEVTLVQKFIDENRIQISPKLASTFNFASNSIQAQEDENYNNIVSNETQKDNPEESS